MINIEIMKSKNKKSRIQPQKINSDAIQYSMLKLKEQKIDLSKTDNQYKEFIKSVELDNIMLLKHSAGSYTKFVGKMVDYEKVKDFIKKTFVYIVNGSNSFWITINVYSPGRFTTAIGA